MVLPIINTGICATEESYGPDIEIDQYVTRSPTRVVPVQIPAFVAYFSVMFFSDPTTTSPMAKTSIIAYGE